MLLFLAHPGEAMKEQKTLSPQNCRSYAGSGEALLKPETLPSPKAALLAWCIFVRPLTWEAAGPF
jgi:hypothetical protein